MEQLIDSVGWVQEVIINKQTGHLVDGHLRVQIALDRDEAMVPVKYIDISDEQEKLLLATYDPIAQLAGTDAKMMQEVLGEVGQQQSKLQAVIDQLLGDAQRKTAGDFLTPLITPPNVEFGDAAQLTRLNRRDPADDQDDDDTDDDGGGDPLPSSQGVFVQISYAATPQQRGIIVQALNNCKTALGLDSSIAAFTYLCQQWLDQHPADTL